MPIIEARNVTKVYPERQGPRVFFGRGGLGELLRRAPRPSFAALRDVSLSVEPGETLGIIGSNGSGKSTLLKILAGVTLPSSGEVEVHGRVASLLELGAGFHPMLTGRENVYLNASIYGLRASDVDVVFDEIVAFSGIGPFIDKPVDTYSSGMYVRIAFAVAAHVNPDIFLVDEVLAVGDEEFQRKCRRKMGELREQGKTILFVSHDLGIVNTICERVILLNRGELLDRGSSQKTFDYYLRQIGQTAGIHRMAEGPFEALFSNGRLSLFVNGEEITAPDGIYPVLESMGQTHDGRGAEWKVQSAAPTSCEAVGVFPRVPARVTLTMKLDNGKLHVEARLTAEHDFSLELFALTVAMPASTNRWSFEGETLSLPELTPSQVHPEPASMPDSLSRNVLAFSGDEDTAAALGMIFNPIGSAYLHLVNGDYLSGTRMLHWHDRPPLDHRALHPGDTRALGVVTLDLSISNADARARSEEIARQRQCEAGGLVARMGRGHVMFETCEGKPVAELQTLICSGDLWTNSTFLASTATQREGDALRMVSRSGRLPLALEWTITPHPAGIAVTVALRAERRVSLQECNFSLILPAAYSRWSTDSETLAYPEFEPTQEWKPLPSSYGCASAIHLHGEGMPSLTWHWNSPGITALPCALNTGAAQARRVAQWLRRPQGADALHFDVGSHLLLSAIIRIDQE